MYCIACMSKHVSHQWCVTELRVKTSRDKVACVCVRVCVSKFFVTLLCVCARTICDGSVLCVCVTELCAFVCVTELCVCVWHCCVCVTILCVTALRLENVVCKNVCE